MSDYFSEEEPTLSQTVDFAEVIKAYTKSHAKKKTNISKTLERKLDAVVAGVNERVASLIDVERQKIDVYVSSLKLGERRDPVGPTVEDFTQGFLSIAKEEQKLEGFIEEAKQSVQSQAAFRQHVEHAVDKRRATAHKCYKKIKSASQTKKQEEMEMHQLYASSGAVLAKHIKLLASSL